MYETIFYYDYLDQVLKQLPKGAFMTVKANDELNTMIIGWGHIGFLWGKKVFIAYVRCSRHTYSILEKSKEFTVSVPLEKDLQKEIWFCGQKSGRDVDKFMMCNLTPVNGRTIQTPIIGECELHYECKIIYQDMLQKDKMMDDISNRHYSNDDYHMVYYGEIVDSYLYK